MNKSLRICLVTEVHPGDGEAGGAEYQVYFLGHSLLKRKHQVCFLTCDSCGGSLPSKKGEKLKDVYKILPRHWFHLREIAQTYLFLRKVKPDVCFVRRFNSLLLLVGLCRFLRVPIIYNMSSVRDSSWLERIEGDPNPWRGSRFYKKKLVHDINFLALRFVDLICAQTEEQRRKLAASLRLPSVLVCNAHPVPRRPFIKESPQTVLWIGKQWKMPEVFLALAQRLSDLDASFILIGAFSRSFRRKHTGARVSVVHRLPLDEVNRLMKKASVYVNTSLYEGFSNNFIQAWMRETPVVSLNVDPDGVLEQFGIGFHSRTFENLVTDVRFLLENPDKREEMGERARAYAIEHHDIKKIACEYENLFLPVAEERKSLNQRSVSRGILRVMGCDSTQYGSMEKYLVLLTREATSRGHEVTVIYDSVPKVREFVEDLRRAGGDILFLKMRGPFDSVYLAKLWRIIRERNIDTVHAYFTPTCHFVMVLCWLLRIRRRFRTSANMPLTTHTRFRKITPWFKFHFALRQRFYAWFPSKIIALSQSMKDEFVELGVKPSKVVVIRGGVDSRHFVLNNWTGQQKVLREFNLDGCKVVALIARMVPVKGIEYALEAVPLIVDQFDGVKLLFVGDGPLRKDFEEKAGRSPSNGNIIFTGQRTDVRDILAATDVLVQPSFSEGMSNSLLEAMATGTPVVTTDIPPNREIVRNGENGLLVRSKDAKSLATAVVTILSDEQQAKKMGFAGRKLIEEKLNVYRRVQQEIQLYEQADEDLCAG